jgi:hypothetical protein
MEPQYLSLNELTEKYTEDIESGIFSGKTSNYSILHEIKKRIGPLPNQFDEYNSWYTRSPYLEGKNKQAIGFTTEDLELVEKHGNTRDWVEDSMLFFKWLLSRHLEILENEKVIRNQLELF